MYYVFLDEIQMLNSNFADLINGLMHIENLDIYVAGSNSKFLSSDILTANEDGIRDGKEWWMYYNTRFRRST